MSESKKDRAAGSLSRKGGVSAPRRKVWNLEEEKRLWYRDIAQKAHEAKLSGHSGSCPMPAHEINIPSLQPESLMPALPPIGLSCLSLFCGGGGLDIGFEAAGFAHAACYEILPQVAGSLSLNRPSWAVYGGEAGDVTRQDWGRFSGIDVMVGGPPCQPYSQAGQQHGKSDARDMIPMFVQAIMAVLPAAFVLENVAALLGDKFKEHVTTEVIRPLSGAYHLHVFTLDAAWFGVPQARRRAFIVGFRSRSHFDRFTKPRPTHRLLSAKPDPVTPPLYGEPADALPVCMGARQALGLSEIGFDAQAPTIRSGMTGPRYTTSVVSGQASQRRWTELQVWPHGVNRTREGAQLFPTPNGHFRLSVPDCAMLQGFPDGWRFPPQAYLALGILGNSVCPPVAYHLAKSIRTALTV